MLGADFLAYHKLSINLDSRRLSETFEVQRGVLDEPSFIPSEYEISTSSPSDRSLLDDLQLKFSNILIMKDNNRSCINKHSVVADVETSTETPVHSHSEALHLEQYKGKKEQLTRLLDQGIFERSQSPWTSRIVVVKKSLEIGNVQTSLT